MAHIIFTDNASGHNVVEVEDDLPVTYKAPDGTLKMTFLKDVPAYVHSIEAHYEDMWRRAVRAKAPKQVTTAIKVECHETEVGALIDTLGQVLREALGDKFKGLTLTEG